MTDIWWKAHPHDLHRLQDRVSSVYIERCHVDRDENAVVVINKRETVRIPAALVAVLLLGPGTRITHGAVNLLGDSGTAICWVGQQGVRLYASGLGPARGAGLLHRQAYLVTRPKERLNVARAMYAMRFPGEDVSTATMQQLRGREGTRIRKHLPDALGTHRRPLEAPPLQGRRPLRSRRRPQPAVVGRQRCSLWHLPRRHRRLGASPGLGFVHTGSAISFVLDIADLYKADYTIPLAFDLAAKGLTEERDARTGLRDLIAENRLLGRIVHDIKTLLAPDESTRIPIDEDVNQLWDEHSGAVAGGVNWSGTEDLVQPGMGDQHIAIIGPEFDPPAGDPPHTP